MKKNQYIAKKIIFALTALVLAKKSPHAFAEKGRNAPVFKGSSFCAGVNSRLFQEDSEKNDWGIFFEESLFLRGFTVKATWKESGISFSESPDIHEPAWGATLKLEELIPVYFPLTIWVGNIKASGSASHLKRPYFYSGISFFSNPDLEAENLKICMPCGTDWKKPFSGALVFDAHDGKSILNRLNFSLLLTENEESIFFASFRFGNARKGFFSFSYSMENYFAESSGSSWFSQYRLFPDSEFFCQNAQLFFQNRNIKSRISAGFYKNQYDMQNPWSCTFCWENAFRTRSGGINFSAYSASSPAIITPAGYRLKTVSLYKLNPFLILYSKDNKRQVKLGFCTVLEDKVSDDGEGYLGAKAGTGIEMRSAKLRITGTAQVTGITPEKAASEWLTEASYTANTALSVYGRASTAAAFSCSFSTAPSEQTATWKTSARVYLPGGHSPTGITRATISTAFLLKTKDGEADSSELDFSAAVKVKRKKLCVNTAFSVKYIFL